jgi:hypothetical protein
VSVRPPQPAAAVALTLNFLAKWVIIAQRPNLSQITGVRVRKM